MHSLPFYIVDVFAQHKYAGNQLAVFVDWEGSLSTAQMQQIANEINFAESTFIQADLGNSRYRVRIFTPAVEMPFAGHPSLGTGYILAKQCAATSLNELTLALNHADIPIQLLEEDAGEGTLVFMQQAQPTFGEQYLHAEVAAALDIPLSDLDTTWPIHMVNTGVPYFIIGLRSLAAMEALHFSGTQLFDFQSSKLQQEGDNEMTKYPSVFFFTPNAYEDGHHYNTRMFHLQNGLLLEDAATGSANGCFLAYLLHHHAAHINVVVEQGYQMSRPSCLYLRGERTAADHYELGVGGRVQPIAQGIWFV